MIQVNQHPVVSAGVIAEAIRRAAERLEDTRVTPERKQMGETYLVTARNALTIALEADSQMGFCFAGLAAIDATDQALHMAGNAAGELIGDQ